MKQSSAFISTYAADTMGVPSALFELGGMVVMHDASGCNSTYNTHDEPRWYDFDSMVFLSGLSHMEALMGDDNKLIDDVCAAAEELHPRFIALASTLIPTMVGTDMKAIARVIERRTGIPAFFVPSTGMGSYIDGASAAFVEYLKRFADPHASKAPARSVNLLGVTPLDFSVRGGVEEIRSFLEEEGFTVHCCLAMGSSPKEIDRIGGGRVNLVLSSAGLGAAKYLYSTFGIPYVVGSPWGEDFGHLLAQELRRAEDRGENSFPCVCPAAPAAGAAVLGESVACRSLAAALSRFCGIPAFPVATVGTTPALCDGCLTAENEDAVERALAGAKLVIGDPLFRPIVPAGARFIPLPHEGFSGRAFRKSILNPLSGLEIMKKEAERK